MIPHFTLGVEEELLLLDADTLTLASRADEVLSRAPAGSLVAELALSQVEAVSPVCASLAEVRAAVVNGRSVASAAAVASDLRIASCGLPPLGDWRASSYRAEPPYSEMAATRGHLIREQLIAGLHVHVGVGDPVRAVAALDRIRDWLPVLLALSASSPFWSGADSGFASWRAVHWRRWPVSGPPPHFGSPAGYDGAIASVVSSGVVAGERSVYWDARRSARFPTVEVRICDAVQTVDEVVALVGVIRGLVAAALDEHDRGIPALATPEALLRLATWQAARSGLRGLVVPVGGGAPVPVADAVAALVERIEPWLGEDAELVIPVIAATLASGGGAARQRAAFETGGLKAAAALVVAETMEGVPATVYPRVIRPGSPDADERRLLGEKPPHHG